MMKFAMNHPHRFHKWSSGFLNGFMTFIIPVGIELATAYLLAPISENVLYDLTDYIYLASIGIIPVVFAYPLKQDPLFKLLIDRQKPVALTIDRTSSNKNIWKGEKYLDSMFGGNFTGSDIPSEVYEKWYEVYSYEESRLGMKPGFFTEKANSASDSTSDSDEQPKKTTWKKLTDVKDLFVPKLMPRVVFFKDREPGNQFAFLLYRLARLLYVGYYYYWSPFVVVYLIMDYNKIIEPFYAETVASVISTEL